MRRHLVSLFALLSLGSLLAGCGGSPSVAEVRWELARRFPEVRFEPAEHVHLGRLSMGLLHGVARLAADHGDADDREGVAMFSQIHSVDFASYKVHGRPDLDRLATDTRFESALRRHGWSLLVCTREEKESTWVYVRGNDAGVLSDLFVVSLEANELTLVRVDGRLDRVFAMAMAEHPKKAFGKGEVKPVALKEEGGER